MNKFNLTLLFILSFCTSIHLFGQNDTVITKSNYTPYELLSSYYGNNFKPFSKKNIYAGFSFSLSDKKMENTDYLIQKVVDGEKLNYDILLKGGYYTGNYGMLGINLNYFQQRFEGTIFRDPDTLKSNSITRGYSITPNLRSSVPLTANERLSFFTEVGLTFGTSNTLTRNTKNLDEIEKSYLTLYNFRLGLSPGITFFAMENFAFEIQLNVLGYELNWTEKTVNEIDKSKDVRQNVSFEIDILSLQMGLSYYFGATKK